MKTNIIAEDDPKRQLPQDPYLDYAFEGRRQRRFISDRPAWRVAAGRERPRSARQVRGALGRAHHRRSRLWPVFKLTLGECMR